MPKKWVKVVEQTINNKEEMDAEFLGVQMVTGEMPFRPTYHLRRVNLGVEISPPTRELLG